MKLLKDFLLPAFRKHIKIALCLIFFALQENLLATSDSTINYNIRRPDYYIDDYQERIDLLDGSLDGKIELGDSATSAYADRTYYLLIDSIQRLVDRLSVAESKRKIFRDAVYSHMRKINPVNVYNIKRWDYVFKFLLGQLNAMKQKNLYGFLTNNLSQSFNTLSFFKTEACADSFLVYASAYRPDLVFLNYDNYSSQPYSRHVIEEAMKCAPVFGKKYLNPKGAINESLKESSDTVIKIILQIKNKYGRQSNAFALIDDIMNGKLTLEKADAVGKNPQKYLRTMLAIRARSNPLAVYSLDKELEIYSLKFVRVLNDLHNEKEAVRFASIENFTAEELYTLIVYSEEEIFTSTFNGLFKRMMVKLGPVSGAEFLDGVGNNRFRTFIKMCAGFGKLTQFLQTMTSLHQQILMIKFASGLEKYNDLSQAVEVADAFNSMTDSLVLKILKSTIKLEYIRVNTARNRRGTAIYGLLSNLFVEKSLQGSNRYALLAKQYSLPNFDRVSNSKLFAADSVNRWLIYFYDDEDGDASFNTFSKTFIDPNWKIIDSGLYVIIRSDSGMHVNIYANKPKSEYEGQARLEQLFTDSAFEPNVMVHRGHSYYASKTIEKIKDNTQIFVLGSCGGYHSISTVIEQSPDISIISSKQIGTQFVNNPMIKLMAEDIRLGNDIAWQSLWDGLQEKVKPDAAAYERFLDYIPPHKNLGAIFIKTYNKMMENY